LDIFRRLGEISGLWNNFLIAQKSHI
jgi:hypothetical protein